MLVEFGDTKVICTASIEDKVPPFLKGQGKGWVTAEYGMLPRSTNTRMNRERGGPSGRSQEIQRLVGRSLRAVVEMAKLGERTVWLDCDVIQADGGTRHGRHHGKLHRHGRRHRHRGQGRRAAERCPCATASPPSAWAWSAGAPALDLDYVEDSSAEVDMNVVDDGRGRLRRGAGNGGADAVRPGQPERPCSRWPSRGSARLVALQRRAVDARGEVSFVL